MEREQKAMGQIIVVLIYAVIMGFATQAVIENKGYKDNWFWWGFFFGLIALIVAVARPQCVSSTGINMILTEEQEKKNELKRKDERMLQEDGWKCICGRLNASYIGTCSCGRTRSDIKAFEKKKEREQNQTGETERLKQLQQYKALLDCGALTEEEFAAKKKQLLNL